MTIWMLPCSLAALAVSCVAWPDACHMRVAPFRAPCMRAARCAALAPRFIRCSTKNAAHHVRCVQLVRQDVFLQCQW